MKNKLDLLCTSKLKIQFFASLSYANNLCQPDVENDMLYKVNLKYIDKRSKFIADKVFIYNDNVLVLYNNTEYKFYGIRNENQILVIERLGGQKLVTKDTTIECLYDLSCYYKLNRFKIVKGSLILYGDKIELYFTEKEKDRIRVYKYLNNNLKQECIIPKDLFKFKVYNK